MSSANLSSALPARRSLPWRRIAGGFAVLLVAALLGVRFWLASRPGAIWQRGQQALEEGRRDDAEQAILDLEDGGHLDEANHLRAELQFRSRQYGLALRTLQSISDQSPLHLKAVALIGRCYLAVGRCTEAEGVFRYLHEKAPTDVDALKGLAAAHFDLGALPQALESCWKWAELEPASGPARRFEGVIYKEMQKFAEAVEPLRAALALGLPDEQRQEALAELATCHLETKQYAEAIEVLQQLPPAMARSTAAREIRAEALRNLGRSDEAAALLDALLRDHPHQLAPLRVRALVHFDQDQPRQAALLLEKAVVLAPRNQRLRVHLAQAYAALGENAKAAEQQGEAARLEKIVRELSDLTNHDLPNDYRNPALHERVAALYTELGLSQPAQRSRQIADMLRQNP